ncbi:condensation domain-containing protein [Nocardia wallacei]|uniref:condensation domain-containing protein n=1 Tax=Nocardia wallacei TaxID=480035 RepID=UPI002453D1CF|nr:condensation domain-containing protein [Nocardia wallacei]
MPDHKGIPLSLSQQAALLPERLRKAVAANLFRALELPGDHDATALAAAADAVVAEHEILRTVYPQGRRMPSGQVVDAPEGVLERVDTPADGLEAALEADARHRFDLTQQPPVRIRLHRMPDRRVLSIAVHPVAADDAALDLLVERLLSGPAAATGTRGYSDYGAAQLRNLTATADSDPDVAYWVGRLADLPAPLLPMSAATLAHSSFRLDTGTVAGLTGSDRTAGFAALVSRALYEAGAGTDIAVGIVDPARPDAEAEKVIGNFANYLVLRQDPSGGRTPAELIGAAAEATAEARAHAGVRIERLTHLLRGNAADDPLFQVLVAVRDEGGARELVRHPARPRGIGLTFDIALGGDGATVTVGYPDFLAGQPQVDEFVEHLELRCREWGAAPDAALPESPDFLELFVPPSAPAVAMGESGLGGPPQTDAERVVVEAIREILELDEDDEIGREDTFFSLGGDSIAALKLVTVLAQQGHALQVQTVFGYPVIHELAAQLTEFDGGQAAAAPVPESAPMSASGLDADTLGALGKRFAGR